MRGCAPVVTALVLGTVLPAAPQPVDLMTMSLEQLMNVEVTSVSKKTERLFDAASAVSVITGEDIRRSGARFLAEALRLVPGVQVARINENGWAISARGFNGQYSNKLLVLIDGRTVYSPLFSGVFWDEQDTLLEDVDRIEVIRGPGATLWGANAVNGVINVITRSAADTQGGLVTAGGGSVERGFGGARWGGTLGPTLAYRAYGKANEHAAFRTADGHEANDDWSAERGGFRLDYRPTATDLGTLQGELYRADENTDLQVPLLVPPFGQGRQPSGRRLHGGNLLGRWTHELWSGSDVTLQAYYDGIRRVDQEIGETVDTFDLDLQHRWQLGERNDVTWGLGYRYQADDVHDTPLLAFVPSSRRYALYSGFVQDEVMLVRDRLRLTLGSKFEHNDFSGFDAQPSGRLLWTPHPRHTLWLAVSRAVRTPSRTETGLRFPFGTLPAPGGVPVAVVFRTKGNPNAIAETLLAYEAGYRVQPFDSLLLDVTGFHNDYDDVTTLSFAAPRFRGRRRPHLLVPATFTNRGTAHSWGVESTGTWSPVPRWRLVVAQTWLRLDIDPSLEAAMAGTTVPAYVARDAAGSNPENQLSARSYLDLPWGLELDTMLYYVDALPFAKVSSYVRLDLRLGWHPIAPLEISIAGQNLVESRHLEFDDAGGTSKPTEIPRSVYGRITWRF